MINRGIVPVPEVKQEAEAVEISTGAAVPPGVDAVLPMEHASRVGNIVHGGAPAPGRHIRRTGEDAPAGACLAPTGTRVGPALLGVAAEAATTPWPSGPGPGHAC